MTSSIMNIPRKIPLLVIGNDVLLPGASIRIPVKNPKNMVMVRQHLMRNSTLVSTIIGVIPKEPGAQVDEIVDKSSLHPIGTAAVVVQITGTNWPQPSYTLLVTGLCRFKLEGLIQQSPYLIGLVKQVDQLTADDSDTENQDSQLSELVEAFKEKALVLMEMLDIALPITSRLKSILTSVPSHKLADVCVSIIKASYAEKLEILDAIDLSERFKKTLPLLERQIDGLQLLQKAKKSNLEKPLHFKQIKKRVSLDDFDGDNELEVDDISELENKLRAAKMPDYAHKVAMKELQRLKKMMPQMPEHALTRTYLELMSELPWSKSSNQTLDIYKARSDLDADHYAMDKVKKRILEYLAVRQLKSSLKGPILCFVGPPGVGKTSIGRSVASTLGREFHRIALGGVCDQSDIRGHRRTYIGALPGRIIQGLRIVGVNNPVFLLDEIDKLSAGIHGDPAAALLEVLDPEQNCNFTDHYLNVPFDLSQVLFIATANSIVNIPPALLDRMEVIPVPGYTQEEKLHIGLRHLIPKQLTEHGLVENVLQIPDESVKLIISRYTREAGVRNLERKIGALCRAVAVKVAEKKSDASSLHNTKPDKEKIPKLMPSVQIPSDLSLPPEMPIILDEHAVEDILGPPVFENEISGRLGQPGVAVGLAWTPLGGDIMFVEATTVDGDGELILTGQLGDVMKESAKLALNWVRRHAENYGIKVTKGTDFMENRDVHIHFPAGAVGKDGPSAGVTVVTVLVSLFTSRCVSSDIAMTGEITLRGLVLPVGGIKEKVLAAHRAGIQKIILPQRNQKDLHDIPTAIQNDLTFIFVNHVDDVLQAAFEGGFPESRRHFDQVISSNL